MRRRASSTSAGRYGANSGTRAADSTAARSDGSTPSNSMAAILVGEPSSTVTSSTAASPSKRGSSGAIGGRPIAFGHVVLAHRFDRDRGVHPHVVGQPVGPQHLVERVGRDGRRAQPAQLAARHLLAAAHLHAHGLAGRRGLGDGGLDGGADQVVAHQVDGDLALDLLEQEAIEDAVGPDLIEALQRGWPTGRRRPPPARSRGRPSPGRSVPRCRRRPWSATAAPGPRGAAAPGTTRCSRSTSSRHRTKSKRSPSVRRRRPRSAASSAPAPSKCTAETSTVSRWAVATGTPPPKLSSCRTAVAAIGVVARNRPQFDVADRTVVDDRRQAAVLAQVLGQDHLHVGADALRHGEPGRRVEILGDQPGILADEVGVEAALDPQRVEADAPAGHAEQLAREQRQRLLAAERVAAEQHAHQALVGARIARRHAGLEPIERAAQASPSSRRRSSGSTSRR